MSGHRDCDQGGILEQQGLECVHGVGEGSTLAMIFIHLETINGVDSSAGEIQQGVEYARKSTEGPRDRSPSP